jgi:hypothetical protein
MAQGNKNTVEAEKTPHAKGRMYTWSIRCAEDGNSKPLGCVWKYGIPPFYGSSPWWISGLNGFAWCYTKSWWTNGIGFL